MLDNSIISPINTNFLSKIGFDFAINKIPGVNFFVQRANIPSITTSSNKVPSPFSNIRVSSAQMDYGDLTIQFKVNDDMSNYIELYTWMKSFARPAGFQDNQYSTELDATSDGTLLVTNQLKSFKTAFQFSGWIPIYIVNLQLDLTLSDDEFVTATAVFAFTYFTIQKIT